MWVSSGVNIFQIRPVHMKIAMIEKFISKSRYNLTNNKSES
jgi:hypothetical protein